MQIADAICLFEIVVLDTGYYFREKPETFHLLEKESTLILTIRKLPGTNEKRDVLSSFVGLKSTAKIDKDRHHY